MLLSVGTQQRRNSSRPVHPPLDFSGTEYNVVRLFGNTTFPSNLPGVHVLSHEFIPDWRAILPLEISGTEYNVVRLFGNTTFPSDLPGVHVKSHEFVPDWRDVTVRLLEN